MQPPTQFGRFVLTLAGTLYTFWITKRHATVEKKGSRTPRREDSKRREAATPTVVAEAEPEERERYSAPRDEPTCFPMIDWRQFESVVGCFLECVLCVLLLAVMYVMMTDVKVVVTPLYRQLSCTVSAVLTVQYSLLRLVFDSSVCVAHRVGLVLVDGQMGHVPRYRMCM